MFQSPLPGGGGDTCSWRLYDSSDGQDAFGAWIDTSGGNGEGLWKWQRSEYDLRLDASVSCPTTADQCVRNDTNKQTFTAPSRKKEWSRTSSSTQNVSGGLIPLFLFLVGTEVNFKKEDGTKVSDTIEFIAEPKVLYPGDKVTLYWHFAAKKYTERRGPALNRGTRNRSERELTGYVGGVNLGGALKTFNECTRSWSGPNCTTNDPTVFQCEVSPNL